MNVPKLALGTWTMGGGKDPDPNNDDAKDIASINLALDNQVALIDTAQNYAAGRCEELVGEALKGRNRNEYQILTKQAKEHLSYQEVMDGCHASMKRLGVDYLDYFLCHAPNLEFDMRDFFKAANKLHSEGKIKNVGVSNFGPKMLELAIRESATPIVLNQLNLSLTNDDIFSTGTYDYCLEHDIVVQGYRTIAELEENQEALKVLQEVAKARDLTIQQVAISYMNSYKGVVFTIKVSSKAHWDQIKAALEVKLDDDEISSLRKTHQNKTRHTRDFLLI